MAPSKAKRKVPLQNAEQDSHEEPQETSPLLVNDDSVSVIGSDDEEGTSARSSVNSRQIIDGDSLKEGKRSWPIIVAVVSLLVATAVIALGAFVAPAAIEQYAREAIVIKPTGLSIHSFTTKGIRARIQADFRLDGGRVKNNNVRRIGKVGTWVAQKVESESCTVEVYLPEYDHLLLGSASIPKVVVNIREGETTNIDIIADLAAGDPESIKRLANDWLEGRLGQLRITGRGDVSLRSGLIPLGTTNIVESLVFEGHNIPRMPAYNITHLKVYEVSVGTANKGIAANASLIVTNNFPVHMTIPSLDFDILIPGCSKQDAFVSMANATTSSTIIMPNSDVEINVTGLVRDDASGREPCSGSKISPLDRVLGRYIHGDDFTAFVRGAKTPSDGVPSWITDIVSGFLLPVPFPGHQFDDAIKNLTLKDVRFGFPSPFADPDSPEADYRVSGNIEVIAALPAAFEISLNVSRVRGTADVLYKNKKLGFLDLRHWQKAKSQRYAAAGNEEAFLKIKSEVKNVPLRITDEDVFQDMIEQYLVGGKTLLLYIKASVDIDVATALGDFIIRDLPGEGTIPVKAPKADSIDDLELEVAGLEVVDTTETSLSLSSTVTFNNPTEYSVYISYASIHIEINGSIIGEAVIRDTYIGTGLNSDISNIATWDPLVLGGELGQSIGREFLSQYISSYNTIITLRTHEKSFPAQPVLGRVLSKYYITIPTPRLLSLARSVQASLIKAEATDDKTKRPLYLIREATFHLITSTASFVSLSPLHIPVHVESLNAIALYNHSDPVGSISDIVPFVILPGEHQSPRLPVSWSLDSVGYEKVREALGGGLRLDALAELRMRIGRWTEWLWFRASGIGATVRL